LSDKCDFGTELAGVEGGVKIACVPVVGALQNTLVGQLARQLKRDAGRACQFGKREPGYAIFIGVVENAEDVDPRAACASRASAQLDIVAPIARIELK